MGSMGKSQVVLLPFPAQGHIPPMVYLARRLALKGLAVTIVNVDNIHQSLQETWKAAPGEDIRLESIPMHMDLDLSRGFNEKHFNIQKAFCEAIMNLEDPLARLLSQLHENGPKVTCVMSDHFHISAPYAVKKAGLIGASFLPGMAAWAAIEYHLPQLIANGHIPVKDGDDELITYLPGVKIRSKDLPLNFHESGRYDEVGDEMSMFRSRRTKLDSWVLVNTVYDFEPETFDAVDAVIPGKFVAIGPLFPLKSDTSGLLELEWLDRQAPNSILYVSFGSIAVLTFKQFQEITLGLEASNYPFLWAVRPGCVTDMDEDFYASFVNRTQERGRIITWAPQLQVLQHKSIGGFLTHAGWNSIFESICGGVPMLGWPCMFDQSMNTRLMLEEKGVGLSFSKGADGNVSREEIQRKIQVLMEDDKLRRKTAEFEGLARKAAMPGGSSHANLEAFIDQIL